MDSRSDEPARARGLSRFTLVALGAVSVLVALPTLRAPFIYDDTTIIRDNLTLRGWSALSRVWSSPYWPTQGADVSGLYRPLHVALLSVVWNVGGGAPFPFHLYAVALYALVVALVWRLLRVGVGAMAAALAALWLATQPLHVETFASAANSSELLVVAFTIALVFVLRRSVAGATQSRSSSRDVLLVALLAAAAVLSKESGLFALPLAALTAWGWRSRVVGAGEHANVGRSARLWLGGGAAVVVALLARSVVLGAPVARVSIAAPGLDALSSTQRIGAMLSLWPRLAAMLLWPTSLSPYYGPTVLPSHRAMLATLAAIVLVGVIALVVAQARRGERRPLVALGWVVLTYLPASNLLTATGQLIADRTLFGATVGVALGLGFVIDAVPRRGAIVAFALGVVLVARNGVESMRYASAWSSHRTLWQRLVDSSPTEYRGYQLLGIDARERGDTANALALLSRAYRMEPRDRRVRFEYGQVLYSTGRHASAAEVLAPLLRDGDVRREPTFVAMYLDAIGRSRGAQGVVQAGTPLMHGEAAPIAALFVGAAQELLGDRAAADSAYAIGLRASPRDTLLLARRARLEEHSIPR